MEQETINKVAKGVRVFGIVLIVVCLGLFAWSMFRPGANDPLTPQEKKVLEELERQREQNSLKP